MPTSSGRLQPSRIMPADERKARSIKVAAERRALSAEYSLRVTNTTKSNNGGVANTTTIRFAGRPMAN
jgi:hypothetical protein